MDDVVIAVVGDFGAGEFARQNGLGEFQHLVVVADKVVVLDLGALFAGGAVVHVVVFVVLPFLVVFAHGIYVAQQDVLLHQGFMQHGGAEFVAFVPLLHFLVGFLDAVQGGVEVARQVAHQPFESPQAAHKLVKGLVFFGAVVGRFAKLVLPPMGEPFETVHLPVVAVAMLAGFFADYIFADGSGGFVITRFHRLIELLDGGFLAFAQVGDLLDFGGVERHGMFLVNWFRVDFQAAYC